MKKIDLTGRWKFKSSDGAKWMDALVPGDVYSDLFENGEIPDPYVGKNESDVQWVARTDWVYKKEFHAKDEFLNQEKHLLDFRGLDTVAEISLNGNGVGEAKNAHRRYEYDVGDYLQRGKNRLKVLFHSPVQYGLEQGEKYKFDLVPHRYPIDQPGREFVRKPQCHFGWDWGPSMPTMGIYRSVELAGFSGPRIRYLKTEQNFHDRDVLLNVKAGLEVPTPGDYEFKVNIGGEETSEVTSLEPGRSEVTQEVKLEKPDLWWPVGYGEQALHELGVRIGGDDQVRSLGFRQFELVREEDSEGESFYFKVNDTPVYAKGANTVPIDALPGRITRKRYSRLIDSAVSANMNTLRVWGGGIYESDDFYELCDRKGIMVWQDFGFACSPYPANENFLENVEEEVRYQVRRLGSHPSLALWCGDNENEWLGKNGDYDTENLSWEEGLADDYSRLNETIRRTVKEEDPGRPFWPSSPSSVGKSSPNDQSIGDNHYWDVWHGGKPFSDYLTTKPRFVSEFGYQSFPSAQLLEGVMDENELNPTSPTMEYRQRHPTGNELIVQRITDNFRFPFSFEDFVYLSQIQQGLAMKTAIEHWRRLKPHCMGTIYWQLNDVWPAISWSSLEYGGGWKALHHFAKRFYAPVLVSTREVEDSLEVWITSDVRQKLKGKLKLSVFDLLGEELWTKKLEVGVPKLASEKYKTVDLEKNIASHEREHLIVRVGLTCNDYRSNNYHFFAPFKSLDLPQPNISKTFRKNRVVLRTDKPALFVKLSPMSDKRRGRFSKSYFHLLPGYPVEAKFVPSTEKHPGSLQKSEIEVKHLRNTY